MQDQVVCDINDTVEIDEVGFHYLLWSYLFKTQEDFIQDIDMLQEQGINAADISKLKSAGIATIKVL